MGNLSNINQVDLYLPKIEPKKRLKKVFVSGRSRMPNPIEYFRELSNTLEDYFLEFKNTLFIEFYFDYINTGSSKWLVYVLQQLEKRQEELGGLIEITWKYDEDDEVIQETGELLKTQVSLPILLMAV